MRSELLAVLLCTGCTITHTEGELPELEFPEVEQVCTEKFRVKTKSDQILLECEIKLKGAFIF